MSIKERALILIEAKAASPKQLEERTGIDRYRWQNLKNKEGQKATEEHLEALVKLWPECAYWLITGKTIPSVGQTDPQHPIVLRSVAEDNGNYTT